MYRIIIAVLFAAVISMSTIPGDAYAFQGPGCSGEGCKSDCASCHSLSKEEAAKLLKADKFKAEVTGVTPSPVKGIWEVRIKRGKQSFVVYVDFAKKFLLENIRFTPLEKVGEEKPLKKVDASAISLKEALLMGDPDAKFKVIVFDDPECPYCAKLHKEIETIVAKRKDIAFYIKMYPLPIHPGAYETSKAIVCGKSVTLLDDAFAGKKLEKADCETKEVDDNIRLGKKLNFRGTPTVILPDGRVVPGYVPANVLLNLVDNPG